MGLISKQYTPHGGQVRMLNSSPTTVNLNTAQQNIQQPPQQQQQQQQQLYHQTQVQHYGPNQFNQSAQTQLPLQTILSASIPVSYYPQSTQPLPPQPSPRQGSLLSQLRSWQRSRKLRSLNKQQKEQQQQQQFPQKQHNQIVNPMTNLCYQSMSPLRQDLDGSYKSSSSELISLEACSTTSGSSSRNSISDTQTASPTVSFRNQGDGQIAMHLPGSPGTGSRLIHLNESQLYALQAHFIKNAQDIAENCYASLEAPQHSSIHAQAKEDPALLREPWFYGAISREKAVDTLHNCPTGSFVVRTSGTNLACFALTMRVPHDYNHSGVAHYLILCDDTKFKIKGFTKEFETLTSLIIHHSIMKEQLPCTLRLHDNRSVNSSTTLHSPSGHHYHTVKSHYRSSPSLVYHNGNNNNNHNNNNTIHSTKYGAIYGRGFVGAKSMLRLSNNSDGENDDCGPVYNDVDSPDVDDDPLMVDVDEDPTYQKILDNFRKSMAACS